MKVAVVGGGIVGLFAAYHLEQEGAEVTVFEPEAPGARSVHAAGIIEPTRAYRTNTFAFLRRVGRYVRSGTCRFRSLDARWLVESARQLERGPPPGADLAMQRLAEASLAEYRSLAGVRNDFGYQPSGLLERYSTPAHYAEERAIALARRDATPVEPRDAEDGSGSLFFPEVGWLHTERFVDRLVRELHRTTFVRQRVTTVDLDGTVGGGSTTGRFDATVACSGVTSRSLGVPLTGVRGYGWHVRASSPITTATIFVDQGVAAVPFEDGLKVTGGWDFDLSASLTHAASVLRAVRSVVAVEEVLDANHGSRPCTPDGLPTVGRKDRLTVANGGFRLGWSFAPALGAEAARLALGLTDNDPFLARFCGRLHAGAFA